ncbi:hypothetical protein AOLI_G00018160 [Acnodon oligacanthus]
MAQNSINSSATGMTPFQCMLGYQPPLAPWTGKTTNVPTVNEWMRRSEQVWEESHQQIERVLRRNKEQADKRRGPLDYVTPGDTPPPPEEIDGAPVYAVRWLLDSRRCGGITQHPAKDILDPGMVADFHARYPNKPAPRPRGRPRKGLSYSAPTQLRSPQVESSSRQHLGS